MCVLYTSGRSTIVTDGLILLLILDDPGGLTVDEFIGPRGDCTSDCNGRRAAAQARNGDGKPG